MKDYEVKIPEKAANIIKVLNREGYEAYAVGGCVRDSIMGRKPYDWDITTSAKPEDVKALFGRTVDTGIRHGTVTVVDGGEQYEVTTYRVDGNYSDGRHPDCVAFGCSLEEDLGRRDFTVNSIAYHPVKGFVDPFSGIEDIRGKIIRTVGEAGKRFREDALRMLRAVRFCAQLGFEAEDATLEAVAANRGLILNISAERIRDELNKLLVSPDPMKFLLLRRTGLLAEILPELNVCFDTPQNHPCHIYDVGLHTLHAVCEAGNESILRWTMLLHDVGKPLCRTIDEKGIDHFYGHPGRSAELAEGIMKRLRFDNRSRDRIVRLIKEHDRKLSPEYALLRKAVAAVGDDLFPVLVKVQEADKKAQNPDYLEERLKNLESVMRAYEEIKLRKECVSLKELAVNGDDLIKAGISRGRDVGRALQRLLDEVIADPSLNTREKLLETARKLSLI